MAKKCRHLSWAAPKVGLTTQSLAENMLKDSLCWPWQIEMFDVDNN